MCFFKVKNGVCHGPYLKKVLKKLIAEIEADGGVVLDELYEHYAFMMTSLKVVELALLCVSC